MDDRHGRPVPPDERRQTELRRDSEEKARQTAERAARIKTEYGAELEWRVEHLHGIDDEATRKAAVEILAGHMAVRKLGLEDLRGPQVEEAIGKALAAEEENRRLQERDSEKTRNTEPAAQEKQRQHALKADWELTAREVLDRKPPSPPRDGASRPGPVTPPTPPLTNSNHQFKLAANEVLQRFNDPALQARYQQQEEERREQEIKLASPTPNTPDKTATRGNVPAENAREEGLLGSFVTPATKKRAEEEKAERANEASKNFGRGGGRGR